MTWRCAFWSAIEAARQPLRELDRLVVEVAADRRIEHELRLLARPGREREDERRPADTNDSGACDLLSLGDEARAGRARDGHGAVEDHGNERVAVVPRCDCIAHERGGGPLSAAPPDGRLVHRPPERPGGRTDQLSDERSDQDEGGERGGDRPQEALAAVGDPRFDRRGRRHDRERRRPAAGGSGANAPACEGDRPAGDRCSDDDPVHADHRGSPADSADGDGHDDSPDFVVPGSDRRREPQQRTRARTGQAATPQLEALSALRQVLQATAVARHECTLDRGVGRPPHGPRSSRSAELVDGAHDAGELCGEPRVDLLVLGVRNEH